MQSVSNDQGARRDSSAISSKVGQIGTAGGDFYPGYPGPDATGVAEVVVAADVLATAVVYDPLTAQDVLAFYNWMLDRVIGEEA